MTGRVDGKVALISGAARGQGAAHARLLAGEGAKVVVTDVLDEVGKLHAKDLRGEGLDVVYTHLDVTRARDWTAAVSLTERMFGKLDVLVNNAGIVAFAGVTGTTDREWADILAVNQTGVFYGMRAAIPAMRRSGGGSIINIASTFGLAGVAGYFAYQASKGAIIMMTKAAANEYARENIRANTICPGVILTEMTTTEPEDVVQAGIRETLLRRAGAPPEVSYGVLYLASDESSFVTGTELIVDGGYLAH